MRVRIHEHTLFARDGADLYCDVPLSFPQLALGAEVEVPVLGGTATLKVPGGSQPGQLLKLRGRGNAPPASSAATATRAIASMLEVPARLNAQAARGAARRSRKRPRSAGPLGAAFIERMKKLLG